ncbi:hypothetical protein GCM10027418_17660 [Mariniluteicoccus endophyticus]
MPTSFDSFSIVIQPRSRVAKNYGGEATAKATVIINGRNITGTDGPDPSNLLPSRGPAPARDIAYHMWAATPETRVVPLVTGLAATRREDVDVWVAITQGNEGVRWEVEARCSPKERFLFESNSYAAQLWTSIQDLSWEDPSDLMLRLIRDRCDHSWLKSKGLTWKRGQVGTDDTLSLFFSTPTGWVTEFRTDNITDVNPGHRAELTLNELYDSVRKGRLIPIMRDGTGDPDSIDSIPLYPITTQGKK